MDGSLLAYLRKRWLDKSMSADEIRYRAEASISVNSTCILELEEKNKGLEELLVEVGK